MGKTFRRDQQFRPKKHGRVFQKEQPWKKHKDSKKWMEKPPISSDDITQENFGS